MENYKWITLFSYRMCFYNPLTKFNENLNFGKMKVLHELAFLRR